MINLFDTHPEKANVNQWQQKELYILFQFLISNTPLGKVVLQILVANETENF